MDIPIGKKLRKRMHVEIAVLQDEIVEVLYSLSDSLVLHGGTEVWRCYGGNRFSEDLDFYGWVGEEKLKDELDRRELEIKKFKHTDNLIFSKISNGRVEVRLEINKVSRVNGEVVGYERVDGSFFDILGLGIDDLIKEKMNAYRDRRFVRDIYDIYHLVHFDVSRSTKKLLKEFLDEVERPVDEGILKSLVYVGAVPSFERMVEFIRRRV